MQSALSYHFLSTLFVSISIAIVAAGPLMRFKQRQWRRGLLAAIALGFITPVILFIAQTPTPPLTVQIFLGLFMRATAVFGSGLILISLPPALLFSRR